MNCEIMANLLKSIRNFPAKFHQKVFSDSGIFKIVENSIMSFNRNSLIKAYKAEECCNDRR